jgi:2-polyprenyl-6-methoxyphenol hydroxylase-like FAD-dependent oxidoreductase
VLAARGGGRARVSAGIVVGADGLRSRVARLVGAPAERSGRWASAMIYGHWAGLAAEGYHWHWAPGAGAGAIPTDAGRTCLFASVPSPRFRAELPGGLDALYRGALARAAPRLGEAIQGARPEGGLRAFLAEYQEARDDVALGLLEVSDAVASFRWTLDEVRAHHEALTRHMARELELLRSLDRAGPAAAA